MNDREEIYQRVINVLRHVIDPETGVDVVRMRLVPELNILEDGTVEYIFRPSSPLCPIALTLVLEIIEAIKRVDGVNNQRVTVVDYIGAEDLNAILKTMPLSKNE